MVQLPSHDPERGAERLTCSLPVTEETPTVECTREFRITLTVYRDTSKDTYEETAVFESYAEAAEWLAAREDGEG